MAKKTKKNVTLEQKVRKVVGNLFEWAGNDEDYWKWISEALDRMLDEMLGEDIFGTEGQNDPRGDNRERDSFRVSDVEV